jgi:hypothetical protein
MKGFALAVLGFRVLYGTALLVAPDRVTKSWLGPGDDGQRVALRGLGAREVGIHGAGIAALLTGADVRPWLAVSIAGDLSDVVSTAVGRGSLPAGSAPKTAAVAGGSAALTAVVLARA